MILLRTTGVNQRVRALSDQLQQSSGERVALVVDERHGSVDTGALLKVSVTRSACQDLALYTPDNFAWLCGDYSYYLARQQFHLESSFWLIEYDVRITGNAAMFFHHFANHPEIDYLAVDFRPAAPDWWWYPAIAAADHKPFRCLFPLSRLSTRAIDHCFTKRQSHSRQRRRRMLWPNDESFVATSLANSELSCRDINQLGREFYDDQSFTYFGAMDGDALDAAPQEPWLFHPVLFGQERDAKLARLAQATSSGVDRKDRWVRRVAPKLNRCFGW